LSTFAAEISRDGPHHRVPLSVFQSSLAPPHELFVVITMSMVEVVVSKILLIPELVLFA